MRVKHRLLTSRGGVIVPLGKHRRVRVQRREVPCERALPRRVQDHRRVQVVREQIVVRRVSHPTTHPAPHTRGQHRRVQERVQPACAHPAKLVHAACPPRQHRRVHSAKWVRRRAIHDWARRPRHHRRVPERRAKRIRTHVLQRVPLLLLVPATRGHRRARDAARIRRRSVPRQHARRAARWLAHSCAVHAQPAAFAACGILRRVLGVVRRRAALQEVVRVVRPRVAVHQTRVIMSCSAKRPRQPRGARIRTRARTRRASAGASERAKQLARRRRRARKGRAKVVVVLLREAVRWLRRAHVTADAHVRRVTRASTRDGVGGRGRGPPRRTGAGGRRVVRARPANLMSGAFPDDVGLHRDWAGGAVKLEAASREVQRIEDSFKIPKSELRMMMRYRARKERRNNTGQTRRNEGDRREQKIERE